MAGRWWATPPGRSVLRIIAAAMLETAVVILLAWLNPFQIDQWAYDRNLAVWQRIMADDYDCQSAKAPGNAVGEHPSCGRGRRHVGPPPISIVYMDEVSEGGLRSPPSDQPGATHPNSPAKLLSLQDQSEALQDLAQNKVGKDSLRPRAIFIDFLFDDADPELKDPSSVVPTKGLVEDQLKTCAGATAAAHLDRFKCYVIRVASITKYERWRDNPLCQMSALARFC